MNRRIHRPAGAAWRLALLAGLALFNAPAAAQTTPAGTATPPAPRDTTPRRPMPPGAQAEGNTGGPLLDAPVSRTEYRLGPGDRLDLALFGEINEVHTVTVTPEGSLLVPNAGIARVLGLNLEEAEARVRAVVGRYYRNIDVRLALAQVRTFKVFLVGDVAEPGVRVATAATRVSEVISGARERGVRRRNVTLRRAGGDTVHVDVTRFLQLGDVSANPTLREGDAVIVPTADRPVFVEGRVQYPGPYEFRPGETLAQLLTVANGGVGFPPNAADTLRLVRVDDRGGRSEVRLTQAEAMGARGQALRLQPFDAVYVAEIGNYRRHHTAQVRGQVVYPGTYPIRPDTTTVRDLVEMAGGFTSEASLVEATLRRGHAPTLLQSELDEVPPELLTRDERRILQTRANADATQVVVDFQELFAEGGNALDVPVRSGDVLEVPVRRTDVIVVGAVRTPGAVPHRPGQPVTHFIRAAGGYTRRADQADVVVIRARSGARVTWREAASLDPGDTVVVPFRDPVRPLEALTTVQGIVTTISGLVLALAAVRSL